MAKEIIVSWTKFNKYIFYSLKKISILFKKNIYIKDQNKDIYKKKKNISIHFNTRDLNYAFTRIFFCFKLFVKLSKKKVKKDFHIV